MGIIFTHNPTATTIALSKEPDLPISIGESPRQEIVKTDAGALKVFSRSLYRFRVITIELKLLNHYDRKLLQQFWNETVNGQAEKFDVNMAIDHEEPLQVGATQDGVAIGVGTVLDPDCGSPGGAIQVGDWVRQDRYTYANCRFDQSELVFVDDGPFNFSTRIRMIQEVVI